MARPVILAQATLSRLGETCRGQTLARARALAQAEGLSLSEALSRSGERHSSKRECVGAQGPLSRSGLSEGLSLKRGNSSHLSEGFWLERDVLWAALFSPLSMRRDSILTKLVNEMAWFNMEYKWDVVTNVDTRVVLQWSERNSMALLGGEQLGGEQRYPPQVQASAESDQIICIRMSRVVVY
ncbi:hypothetical protein DEO72_LG6g402 [Vigna unguiculata]|uniref:Uncharacterized protein n=1 Tax=Vigna unguiculata TaxID=3917 RepID=A0A4D6M4F5_VIGUN|nr:hypothetical protein DEO72_LG6g402 [Vigna unguiculata]